MLFSPANKPINPPKFGIVFAMSATAFPACTALFTFTNFTFTTESENFVKDVPNDSSCVPKSSMLFSPTNKPINPPKFGIAFAMSATAFPASAAVFTFSGFTPSTESENFFNDSPNDSSCVPKSSMLFSPTNKPINPPKFGIAFAMSATAFPASAAVFTFSGFTPSTESENFFNDSPNASSCAPNISMEFVPNPRNDVMPDNNSFAVRIKIVSASAFTPVIADASTLDNPSKNGLAFSIKPARLSPISGKPDVALTANPSIILPKKDPRP